MKKIVLIFGGKSNEHDISIKSCECIYKNLDKKKYEITLIYIDKKGTWFYSNNIKLEELIKINNIVVYLRNFDLVFPVLHGKYGEDGTIQGFFEMFNINYVGCNVLSSSLCMDKIYAKILFEKAGIPTARYEQIKYINDKYIYVDKNFYETQVDEDNLLLILENNIGFPMYIKPSRSGSSIGITKVCTKEDIKNAILLASKSDNKIIFEEEIVGREIEIGILKNNDEVRISSIGEVINDNSFYDYKSKYKNKKVNTRIVTDLSDYSINKIKKLALRALNSVDGYNFARIDFFITDEKIYINEINTIPGFTKTSMFPKLFANSGIRYSEILDIIINAEKN